MIASSWFFIVVVWNPNLKRLEKNCDKRFFNFPHDILKSYVIFIYAWENGKMCQIKYRLDIIFHWKLIYVKIDKALLKKKSDDIYDLWSGVDVTKFMG